MRNSSTILVCCLALTSLPAAGVEADYATNGLRRVTSADLARNDHVFTRTYKYVRFEGVVTDQFNDESNPEYCFMTIADDYGTAYFSIQRARKDFIATNDYVGCRIALVGRNMETFSKPKGTRLFLHRELQLGKYGSFTVLETPAEDPFNVPELSPSVGVSPDKFASLGKRKLIGQVLAARSHNDILVLTPRGTISRVSLKTALPPKAGDFIEAVGSVETDTYFLNLTRARWRKAEPFDAAAPPPMEITAREIMTQADGQLLISTRLHGQTVRIRSAVRSIPDPEFGNRTVFAESDGITFPIDASSCPEVVEMLEPGSTVDATGICWVDIDNWRPTAPFPQAEGFTLVLRSPDDVTVVAYPPWWTPARLAWVIGALLALLVGFLAWNRALSHAARRMGLRFFREQVARVTAESKAVERSRLAVELHDSISQILTGVALKIKSAQTLARTDIEKSLKNLAVAENALRSSREELRYCLWDLRNNILDMPVFEEAVRQMLKPLTGDAELAVRFPVSRRRIPDATAHVILQIIRELAVNAIHHGNATRLRIAGNFEGDVLSFSVTDNGTGYDESSAPGAEQGHFGILGIQDRLAHYNGTLSMHGEAGRGTKAIVSMQIKQEKTETST